MPWLINAEQLASFRKNQKNLVILDATCNGADSATAKQEYVEKHIPGARFFDINAFIDPNSDLPNTLLQDEARVAEQLGGLGLRTDCKIILYDRSEHHTSCRALWMLKMYGHPPQLLYILDGGLPAWEKFGGKFESEEPNVAPKTITIKLQQQYFRTLAQMKKNVSHPTEQVLDARHAVRYAGGAEPRAGLRTGHIPGSFCFPFTAVFEPNGCFLPLEKIRRRLEGIGVNLSLPIITTCGSGTTAPVLNFVLDIMGSENNSLYDGSWTEWGAEKLFSGETSLYERPVETSI